MRNNAFISGLVILAIILSSGCMPVHSSRSIKRRSLIEVPAGRLINEYGISIDANYDPRLDGLISGYKLIPVVIRNLSLNPIMMDPEKDRWIIVGEKGQTYTAVNSLRVKDPVRWRDIPDTVRSMIDYPEVIPLNYSVTFDLLLPEQAHLDYFKAMRFRSETLKQNFVIQKEY